MNKIYTTDFIGRDDVTLVERAEISKTMEQLKIGEVMFISREDRNIAHNWATRCYAHSNKCWIIRSQKAHKYVSVMRTVDYEEGVNYEI